MKKKRVFHIISRLDVGGAERVAINIASSAGRCCEHHIVELQRGHSSFTRRLVDELRSKGIPCHRSLLPIYFHLHCYVDRLVSVLFPFRFLLLWLKYRPDVVHSHTEMPDMAVWLTLRLFPFIKIKVIRTIHNTVLWSGMQWVGPRVERFMQSRNANVAISPGVQRAYNECYGGLPPYIYNGISPVAQRPYSGIVAGKTNILFAGRFEEQKGIAVLCDIIRAVSDDGRYHFHIFGAGRQQYLIDSLSGMDNVSVHPPLHGITELMQSFDYLIMPSVHEGLPIIAIEASMNGLPVMINRCEGLSDAMPEDWPLSVAGNSMEQWLRLFREVLPDMDRNSLRDRAKRHAEQHFLMEKMQRAYEAIVLASDVSA